MEQETAGQDLASVGLLHSFAPLLRLHYSIRLKCFLI